MNDHQEHECRKEMPMPILDRLKQTGQMDFMNPLNGLQLTIVTEIGYSGLRTYQAMTGQERTPASGKMILNDRAARDWLSNLREAA